MIQTILFLAGINTLLQVHFGTRLPAVMGGSFTYIYAAVAIIISPRYILFIGAPFEVRPAFMQFPCSVPSCPGPPLQQLVAVRLTDRSMPGFFSLFQRFVYTMRSLQGALIIAGVFQAVIGFFGIWRVFIRLSDDSSLPASRHRLRSPLIPSLCYLLH